MIVNAKKREDGKFEIEVEVNAGAGSFQAPIYIGAQFIYGGETYTVTDMDSVIDGNLVYIVDAVKT